MSVGSSLKIHYLKDMIRLLVCIAVVIVTLLAAGSLSAATTVGTSPPQIRVFSAEPMVLPDGASAVYVFEVNNATKIQLIEAGEVIREIDNPLATSCSGKAKGRTTYQIRTRDMNSFNTVLLAVNPGGSQRRALTLSFATKIQPLSITHFPLSDGAKDETKKPEWLDQTTLASPPGLAGQIVSTYPPPFVKCSSNCDYCLQPDDAASRGFTKQCSKQPCYYSPDKQQYWYCYSKPETVWCCADGEVIETTSDSCYKKGGTAYATEVEARKACQAEGWCCIDGKIISMEKSACMGKGGTWSLTEQEAKDTCGTNIWCCIDGQVIQTTREICNGKGGTAYATEADARKACQAEGWCCLDGNIISMGKSACLGKGGTWSSTEQEAKDTCSTSIWCCANGKVMETSPELCKQMGGSGYNTQAEATKACQAATSCWCCYQGKVFQSTLQQCAQYGGNCYSTQAEAINACQATTSCWCCYQGKVFQSTLQQCAQYGGNCYSTQAEATRACQATTTCWCCSQGKVFQSTRTQCAQYGGNCYSTQAEALKACQKYTIK
jgi:cytochrome b involved in lipid metabolism